MISDAKGTSVEELCETGNNIIKYGQSKLLMFLAGASGDPENPEVTVIDVDNKERLPAHKTLWESLTGLDLLVETGKYFEPVPAKTDFSRMELNVTPVLDSVTDHVQNDVGAHQKWVVR